MESLSRREFISFMLSAGMFCPMLLTAGKPFEGKEARYYECLTDKRVRCTLCPWQCTVSDGERGHCGVRINRQGVYMLIVYGQIAAMHSDPIEKKPFYHFLPGSMAFSIATAGCNLDCKFCQNADLAQRLPEELNNIRLSPLDVVQTAQNHNCLSVANPYNEPVVFTEYIQDISSAGREQGMRNVVISNGFINKKPLRDLCRVIDAFKVDLKAFDEDYYQRIVGGHLRPVLDTLTVLREEKVWTEIVYLIVPTLNDDSKSLEAMVKWISQELGPDIPLHFSRFYPTYKLRNLPPTPLDTLEKAYQIGKDTGLHYVYLGNVPGHAGENTLCPSCKHVIIGRSGYQIDDNHLEQGKCAYCHHSLPGVWS